MKDLLRLTYKQASSPSILVFHSLSAGLQNLLQQTSLCSHQPPRAPASFIHHGQQQLAVQLGRSQAFQCWGKFRSKGELHFVSGKEAVVCDKKEENRNCSEIMQVSMLAPYSCGVRFHRALASRAEWGGLAVQGPDPP